MATETERLRMPIRRRTRTYDVTPEVRLAAGAPGVERWERLWGGPAEGRAAWRALGGQLTPKHGTRPECWWSYEPGIPSELREPPERPDPRAVLGGAPSLGYSRAAQRFEDFRQRRLAWLIESGHLEPEAPRSA